MLYNLECSRAAFMMMKQPNQMVNARHCAYFQRNNGNLLGVAGVDVNLQDILQYIQQAQVS